DGERSVPVLGGSHRGLDEPMSHDGGETSGARGGWGRRAGLLAMALGLGVAAWATIGRGRRLDPARRHAEAAHRAWLQGRLDEAAAELGRAGEEGEPDDEVDRLWGLVYARAGRPDDALPLLRRA